MIVAVVNRFQPQIELDIEKIMIRVTLHTSRSNDRLKLFAWLKEVGKMELRKIIKISCVDIPFSERVIALEKKPIIEKMEFPLTINVYLSNIQIL